ncbi:MAG: hypothetical protein IPN76_11220 [Saprospiraceae bacterium]|nr:hypothetical protein [Saprospiraceae bacterium]
MIFPIELVFAKLSLLWYTKLKPILHTMLISIERRQLLALFVLFALGLSHPSSAQLLNESNLLDQPSELLNLGTTRAGSEAYIQQSGNSNQLRVMQQQENLEGNLARVLQTGNLNIAEILQTEGGNKLALIQRGNSNYYELVSYGADNELVNFQDGSNNKISQQLINSNQIRSELVQIGSNNEIIQVLENINSEGFIIRQLGDGLKVTVNRVGQ